MNAAIIGAGSIGGLIDGPKSTNTASHAHAYSKNDFCSLTAICEPDKNNQKEFLSRWGDVKVYEDSSKLLSDENIEILSISTPTHLHVKNLKDALHVKKITHILCEKPLVETIEDLDTLKELLLESDKKILINLIRRYDPSFIKLASLIKKNSFGNALYFHGIFTKGLLHNGIHMLGILSHLLGSVSKIEPLHVRDNFSVECKQAKGVIACMKNIDYSLLELEIIFENAKIEIKDKITIYKKTHSKLYEDYYTLEYQESLENSLNNYASNSLSFLLNQNNSTCKEILKEHIKLHETIFKASENETSN